MVLLDNCEDMCPHCEQVSGRALEVRVKGPPKIWDWGQKNWYLDYVEQVIFDLDPPVEKWFLRAWYQVLLLWDMRQCQIADGKYVYTVFRKKNTHLCFQL